jgi:hypothetical protein
MTLRFSGDLGLEAVETGGESSPSQLATIQTRIMERAHAGDRTRQQFLALGQEDLVDKALHRLVQAAEMQKVKRGEYEVSAVSSEPPDISGSDSEEVPGEEVRYRPRSAAPADFVDDLRLHKPEVIAALQYRERITHEAEIELLDWARDLARREVVLVSPVRFRESNLVPVSVAAVGSYAAGRLAAVALKHSGLRFAQYDDGWYEVRAQEAMDALSALREAIDGKNLPYGR